MVTTGGARGTSRVAPNGAQSAPMHVPQHVTGGASLQARHVGDVGERYVGHALWHEKVDPVDQAMSFLAVSPVFARDYAELLFPGLTSQHLKGLTLGKFAVRERRGIRSALGSTKRTIYRNPIMPSYPVPQKLKSLGVFQRYWDPFLAPLALRLTFPPQGGVFLGSDFCYWAEQFMGDSAPWDWAPLGIGLGVAPVGDDGVELGVWVGRVRGVPKRAILAGVLREVSPVVMALRELGARVQLRWVWSYFARSHGFDLRPHSKLPTSFLSGVGYLRYADLEVSKGVQLVPEMQSHDLIHGASPLMPWTWECRHFDGNGQLLSRNPVSNLQLARI